MAISLNKFEQAVAKKLAELKKQSSSHSPSPAMITGVEGVKIKHDFCYLSNPYATELFLKYFVKDMAKDHRLRNLVEYYPSQNRTLAEKLAKSIGVPAKNIFVGNGAAEIIQAVLHNFVRRKMLVPVPTFSPYLEFAPAGIRVVYHQLLKEDDFRLNTTTFVAQVKKEKPDAVVLINPNNPDGGHLPRLKLGRLLEALREVPTVIVDESFVHFAGNDLKILGVQSICRHSVSKDFPNVVVIKSLSKDFGIAGLRLGYAIMSEARVSKLLSSGYLWNVSGFGEYFLGLLNNQTFLKAYEKLRLRAVREREVFFKALSKVNGLKVYPSSGNFFLAELIDGSSAHNLMVRLLVKHGIYIRPCDDKVGLRSAFVRIASRRDRENELLVRIVKQILSE